MKNVIVPNIRFGINRKIIISIDNFARKNGGTP
jgi:hypothetical protein